MDKMRKKTMKCDWSLKLMNKMRNYYNMIKSISNKLNVFAYYTKKIRQKQKTKQNNKK